MEYLKKENSCTRLSDMSDGARGEGYIWYKEVWCETWYKQLLKIFLMKHSNGPKGPIMSLSLVVL